MVVKGSRAWSMRRLPDKLARPACPCMHLFTPPCAAARAGAGVGAACRGDAGGACRGDGGAACVGDGGATCRGDCACGRGDAGADPAAAAWPRCCQGEEAAAAAAGGPRGCQAEEAYVAGPAAAAALPGCGQPAAAAGAAPEAGLRAAASGRCAGPDTELAWPSARGCTAAARLEGRMTSVGGTPPCSGVPGGGLTSPSLPGGGGPGGRANGGCLNRQAGTPRLQPPSKTYSLHRQRWRAGRGEEQLRDCQATHAAERCTSARELCVPAACTFAAPPLLHRNAAKPCWPLPTCTG